MKFFLSHKSVDKHWAIEIEEQLERIGVEVFLDASDLRLGDSTDKIYRELNDSDVLLVLYSSSTESSEWVSKELEAATQANKDIIPCLLDGTVPANNPHLSSLLYADFSELELGFGHLCVSKILPYALKRAGYETEAPKAVKKYEGAVSHCMRDLIVRQQDLDKAAYWRRKTRDRYRTLKAELDDIVGGIHDRSSMHGMLVELSAAVEAMQARLDARLTELIGDEDDEQQGDQPRQEVEVGDGDTPAGGVRGIESYSEQDAQTEIRGFLADRYGQFAFVDPSVVGLHYFIERSTHVLVVLEEIAVREGSQRLNHAVTSLIGYLENPNDLIPEEEWGYVGYLDDAWLIHNVAFRIKEAFQFDPDPFPVDWGDLITADEMARAELPVEILEELESILTEVIGILFGGGDGYAPVLYLDENRVPRFFMSGIAEAGSGVRTIADYDLDEAYDEINSYLAQRYPAKRREMERRADDLYDFIDCSPRICARLQTIRAYTEDPAVSQAITLLLGYLDDPHDLMPADEWGYVGYLDDAWLVNNFAFRIHDQFDQDPFDVDVDWDDIDDSWAGVLLPEGVRAPLEAHLEQLVALFMS